MNSLKISNIPLDDKKTWDLICSGKVKGVFQIESNLGKAWCRKVKPRNIEELSAVISIVRPGVLKSKLDGKSLTQHYADRKNGVESIESYHPVVDEILKDTYNILIYQEQVLLLAQKLAGFDLKTSDSLRKSIGKKIPEEMTKIKSKFLEGCKKQQIISNEQAEELFNWIEKSQRYSFNKSHAISYAIEAYWCAYLKANHPIEFFSSWLRFAKNKQNKFKEIRELIEDARLFGINVISPNLWKFNTEFETDHEKIYYGLSSIKGIGDSSISKIKNLHTKPINRWEDYLILLSDGLNSKVNEALICCGALDSFGLSRNRMLNEFQKWNELSVREKTFAKECYWDESFTTVLQKVLPLKKEGGATANKNRYSIVKSIIQSLKNTPYDLTDDPTWIINNEHNLLGIPLTYNRIDIYDTNMATHTCKHLIEGCKAKYVVIGAEIVAINYYTIKSGQNRGQKMAFLSVSDDTGNIDNIVVFSHALKEFESDLQEKNVVLMRLKPSNKGGWILEKLWLTK